MNTDSLLSNLRAAIPKHVAPLVSKALKGLSASSFTRQSQVGQQLLLSYLSILGRVVIHTSSGIRKAAVLPLPVSATPMMSRFCRPMGMACRWIGVGSCAKRETKPVKDRTEPLHWSHSREFKKITTEPRNLSSHPSPKSLQQLFSPRIKLRTQKLDSTLSFLVLQLP